MLLTDQQIENLGYRKYFNHGKYIVAVQRLLFGKAKLVVTNHKGKILTSWSYSSYKEAATAMGNWDPKKEQEPQGWFRHQDTKRRRPNGDATKQYIQD